MKVYDTILIGSGYFAWGYALTHENTLIVEETQVADRHFGGCLRGFECKAPVLSTEGARALWDHVCALGLFRDGRLSVTGLEAALCEAFEKRFPEILLGTTCMEICREDGGYALSIHNCEGLGTLRARRVIDTRVTGGQWLNVLICAGEGGLPEGDALSPAFYEGQGVCSFFLPEASDINHAKVLAYDRLRPLLTSVGAKAAQTSYRMYKDSAEAPYIDDLEILHVDETFFGDPFTAFEKGELQA